MPSIKQTAMTKISQSSGDPTMVSQALGKLVSAIKEYKIVQEQEITKRQDLLHRRDVAIRRIQAEENIILSYMTHTFQERKDIFCKLFSTLDHAVENNDVTLVDQTLSGILHTLQTSPFKDFESFKRQLSNHETIEI